MWAVPSESNVVVSGFGVALFWADAESASSNIDGNRTVLMFIMGNASDDQLKP
jgi:hypothetical protein